MKIKYTAETPIGTFTRSSVRTYTHVVVAKERSEASLNKGYEGFIAKNGHHYPTEMLLKIAEGHQKDLATRCERTKMFGFAGSQELANKLAASARSQGWVHVYVVEVKKLYLGRG